ncbi:MAG: preprotein translocase subunit SecA [Spirochaetota bacterium]|nr:preprotein translocase subunit SecA [Spirochaetota bacterium]
MFILTKILELFFGTKQDRDLKKIKGRVDQINEFEAKITSLSNEELAEKGTYFKNQLLAGETLDDILPEAFAVIREVSQRTLGMRHFDVQLFGGIALHEGNIAEMKTGEGKTLMATLAISLNAFSNKGVHLVTVNDYLAKRDAQWMAPIYLFLNLSVGIINQDQISFRVQFTGKDFETELVPVSRKEAYACDITYITNNELGFDYLRDNMIFELYEKTQRPLNFAIVDEADSILIDEARTPLIISGPSEEKTDLYYQVNQIIPKLTKAELNDKEEVIEGSGDFGLFLKEKSVTLTEQGAHHIEQLLKIDDLYSPENSKYIHFVLAGIKAHHLYFREIEYIIEQGEIVIIDEFTGRKMAGRRWSDGIHQSIEAKENLKIKQEFQTLASITFQNLFRMYEKLSGMTGTAETEASELYSIYKTDVIIIPTNKPITRVDHQDKMYLSKESKYKALVHDIKKIHATGQPILVGTGSVESSEELSKLLKKEKISHSVLNAKYHAQEAKIVQDAGKKNAITIATNMAGRGTDIKLGEGVREIGGLLVLGAERHEARRIDNQLRGRSGRQGDPGASIFYVSCDDPLMKAVNVSQHKELMQKMGFSEDDEIQDKMFSRVIEMSQKRLENFHFDIRKNILEYDGVMNEQRNYIYTLRDKILDTDHENNNIEQIISDSLDIYADNRGEKIGRSESWDLLALETWLNQHFTIEHHFEQAPNKEELIQIIRYQVLDRFTDSPTSVVHQAIRFISLRTLDNLWKEHLHNIDILRNGIGLQGYAQKSPIVEYKMSASIAFRELKEKLQLDILSILSRLDIKPEQQIPSLGDFSTPKIKKNKNKKK